MNGEDYYGIMIFSRDAGKWIMLPDVYASKEEASSNYRKIRKGHAFRVVAIDIKSQNMLY